MTKAAIKSARRVFEVMELFERERQPLGLKFICETLKYPGSSGAAILKSLVLLGYLEYDRATRTYLPTMRIAVMGQWVAKHLFTEAKLLPLMKTLRDKTRETIILGTQSGTNAQYVHVMHSLEAIRYMTEPGSIRPLARCGIGLALLAGKSDEEIDMLVYRSNYAEPNRARRVALADVMATIRTIRQQGYYFSRGTYTAGVGVIAMLLPSAPFNRMFAVGIGGPVYRLEQNLDQNLAAMRKEIKRRLGGKRA
ncbi:MAG TPA: IclR family transcriptional regulator C-terminal domain-containing protein [Rhodoblastus sp.]|nr:IclR family transcriptional regulator C-terminal domain-containing protein [Rhodoblastus sp.]